MMIKEFSKDGQRILWGDVIQCLETVRNESIDLIFCDPPYNIGKNFNGTKDKRKSDESYLSWCYKWLELCIQKLKPAGSMYVMAATQNMPFIDIFLRKHLTILSRIIWYYDSSGVQAKKYFGSLYEPVLHCVKNPSEYSFNSDSILVEARTGATRKLIDYRKAVPAMYNSRKVPGNVWYIPRVRYRMPEYEEHPAQKPVALLERIILASSNPGDTVLDPFSGTFTTSFAAKKYGRLSVGIEIEEAYIKIGLRRLNICSEYNGEILCPPHKSYKKKYSDESDNLTLFERDNAATSLYRQNY